MQTRQEAPQTNAPAQPDDRSPESASVGEIILRISGLTKRFGSITAVDGLNLEVHRGEVVGLLGPNGAGKSTTVGMILGLIAPDSGSIEILGTRERQSDFRRREIGAIVEQPAFYPYLCGRDNLRAIALAAGGVPAARIDELLRLVDLDSRPDSTYRTYSLGMKQRLGIASTLLTNPALVILDEPTNGLDPAGQREARALIPRLTTEGHGVLVASHLLHEVEQVCDRVVIIRNGKLIAGGTVSELLHRDSILEITIAAPERAAEVLRPLPFVRRVTVEGAGLTVSAPIDSGVMISRVLAEHDLFAAAIVPRSNSLEEIFFELTEPNSSTDRSTHHDQPLSQ